MSELRQNPASGDWVIIAPERHPRPHPLRREDGPRTPAPKAGCPFEDLKKSGNWPLVRARPSAGKWRIAVFQNKYPALARGGGACAEPFRHGIYRGRTGVGAHEIVVTRDHRKNFAALAPAAAHEVFEVFRERIRAFAEDPCLAYAVPFMNWGPKAGASLWHPHYQIIASPIIPPHSARSLRGAAEYWNARRRCVRCEMIREERAEGARMIAENAHAVAFAPYASKVPFEAMIIPKKHQPYFYKTPSAALRGAAELVQSVMRRLKARAGDPDLNFFVHEAPIDGGRHGYHHWHVEILPRLSVPAGAEFSTGIFIDALPPDTAAALLRGAKKHVA